LSVNGPTKAVSGRGPLHEDELTVGTSLEFELALPPDALPSYKSRHGELYWELDVKSDESVGVTRTP
jgi:hypothetical protein